MVEKPESRTKILSLSSGTLIVYQLPDLVSLELIQFVWSEGRLALTDGREFTMNLGEFSHGNKV